MRQLTYAFTDDPIAGLQLAAEFLMMLASIILLISTFVKLSFLVIIYVVLAIVQALYLLTFSIATCVMKINIIANFSWSACIAYWLWVAFSSGISLYFIYIAISYYKLKSTEDQLTDF
ncbi:hypothetical protein ACLKA6_017437 [Drosophila palustris]